MQFNCRVEAAHYDEAQNLWRLRLGDGRELTLPLPHPDARAAVDPDAAAPRGHRELQGPVVPHLPLAARAGRAGRQAGRRDRHRRHRHPGDRRDRRQGGRAHRVPAPAELVRAAQQRADLRRGDGRHPPRYDEIFATCARTPGGFVHEPDRRGFYEVTREERLALWDKLYDEPGFGIWLANFREIFMDEEANAEFSEFIADKIRPRVKDPKVAEKLIPRDHGFGVQRVPLETGYYEAYNRPNVAPGRHQRDADRARHRDGHAHDRARLRVRHHRLRHRLRRHHRRLRPHRHPGRRRPDARRQVAHRPSRPSSA